MTMIGALTAFGLALAASAASALVPISGRTVVFAAVYAGDPGEVEFQVDDWEGVPENFAGSVSAGLDLETGEQVFADATTTAIWSSAAQGSIVHQVSFGANGLTTTDATINILHDWSYSVFAEQDGTVTFDWDVQLNGDAFRAGYGFFAQIGWDFEFDTCRADPVFVSPFGDVGDLRGSLTCDLQGGRRYDFIAFWDLELYTDLASGFADFASGYDASLTWSINEEVVPPPPPPPPVPEVPEPASWALMIAGLGLAGGAMRRRRAGAENPVLLATG